MKFIKEFGKEFKKFALTSNFVSMAVGVVVGGALTKVVTSFVDDIISPIIGLIVRINFNNLSVEVLGVDITYGAFIMALLNALIVLVAVFVFIRAINKLKSVDKDLRATNDTKKCPYCKTEIDKDATRCPNCTSNLTEDKSY